MDYDEFITGMRNEAFFTMSKSFLPRLAAAPAAALPVALLGPLGHRPPVNGSIQPQSDRVVSFCKAITIWAPALLSLASLVLKTRYPLRTKEQSQMVSLPLPCRRRRRRAPKPASFFFFWCFFCLFGVGFRPLPECRALLAFFLLACFSPALA